MRFGQPAGSRRGDIPSCTKLQGLLWEEVALGDYFTPQIKGW